MTKGIDSRRKFKKNLRKGPEECMNCLGLQEVNV